MSRKKPFSHYKYMFQFLAYDCLRLTLWRVNNRMFLSHLHSLANFSSSASQKVWAESQVQDSTRNDSICLEEDAKQDGWPSSQGWPSSCLSSSSSINIEWVENRTKLERNNLPRSFHKYSFLASPEIIEESLWIYIFTKIHWGQGKSGIHSSWKMAADRAHGTSLGAILGALPQEGAEGEEWGQGSCRKHWMCTRSHPLWQQPER